jgi:GNAT superfamily N-acetyltransferase
MGIEVRAVEPDDSRALADWVRVIAAARAKIPDFPPPCPVRYAGLLRHPGKSTEVVAYLADLDGEPAGSVHIWLPLLDNTGNANIELMVDPAYRRRGVGRALYDLAVEQARARGRVRVIGDCVATIPGGPVRDEAGGAFAEAMGAKRALVDVRRRLDLSTVDISGLDVPQAPGYSVRYWREHAPEEYLSDIGRLSGRLFLDAPTGDLVLEPWRVDAERIRDDEQNVLARGERQYHAGIQHDATGALVAWTTLAFEPTIPWHAWQYITIVDPEHRGHRLGTWVKVANLRHTRQAEPALRTVDTWNAAANAHMIAINEALGFRALDEWHQWQRDLLPVTGG